MMLFILSMSYLIVLVNATQYINETKGNSIPVSWDKARKSCNVPQLNMLWSSHDARDKIGFYAWTAIKELSSEWAFFKGCIDISIQKEDRKRLSDYFKNGNHSFIAVKDNVFKCAYHCTNMNYFVYYMTICLCITNIAKYPVTNNPGCVTTCQDDSVFCSSGFGIPLFKYQTVSGLEMNLLTQYTTSYHCIFNKNGYNFEANCYTGSNKFRCDGKDSTVSYSNWVDAVKYCAKLKTTLSKAVDNTSSGVWSRYFRYKHFPKGTSDHRERRKCVAVFIKSNISSSDSIKWSHYQQRNCSTLLPFICLSDIDMHSHATNIHLNSNTTDSSTLQSPSKHTEKNENDVIVKVNIVLLTFSLVMVALFSIRSRCKKKTGCK